jgi:hypothetical protein
MYSEYFNHAVFYLNDMCLFIMCICSQTAAGKEILDKLESFGSNSKKYNP